MYGAPVRQSYRRRGPLDHFPDAAAPTAPDGVPELPGTPIAGQRSGPGSSDVTPTMKERLRHFEVLMDKAMVEVRWHMSTRKHGRATSERV